MSSSVALHLDFTGAVARLTLLVRNGKPPTLDLEVVDQLHAALGEIESRVKTLDAVVVSSEVARYFCVGANLEVVRTLDEARIEAWVRGGHALMNRLESLPAPVIAVVRGFAMGGGLELAMACDLILATESARFAQSEARLGLVSGWGGAYRLARRVGVSRAKELCFTGRMIDAAEACRLGLTIWCGPDDQWSAELDRLLAALRENSRVGVREMKAILNTVSTTTLAENAEIEAMASRRCFESGDAPERIRQFFASRR